MKYNFSAVNNNKDQDLILEMQANSVYEVIELLHEDRYAFLKGKEVLIFCDEDNEQDREITL